MNETKYPNVVRAIRETPWAILPSALATIKEIVQIRLSGGQLATEEIQARIGGRESRRDAQKVGNVAVLPLYGVITHRADMFTDMSGGTSVQRFRDDFLDSVNDKSISGIVFDVDSPGGNAEGLTELAADIRSARGKKPIVAVANTLAASAAYWIASQADEFVMTPSALAGSVGVYAAHDDISGLQEKMGVKTTLISAGKHKTAGNPFEPLSEEDQEMIQQLVDDTYAAFVADVAKGRRISVDTVRSEEFGQGWVKKAKTAVAAGMADRVDTLEAVVAGVAHTTPTSTDEPTSDNTSAATIFISDGQALGYQIAQGLSTATTSTSIQAAESGFSFAYKAEAARRAALALVENARSLARITGAKREQLAEVEAAHRAVADEIAALLKEHLAEEHELDDSAEAEFAWALARFSA